MIRQGYPCGDTLEEIMDDFHITPERIERIRKLLVNEGYSIHGICYGVGKSRSKLLKFVGDVRFDNILINEVRKNATNWYRKKDKVL